MARAPDERAEKAHELFNKGIKLIEIANQLNLPPGTVRRWKSTHKWDGERSEKKSERSVNKKNTIPEEVKDIIGNTELNDKQRLFCLHYSKSFNATQSYLKAYGCSYETAMTNGSALLRNTHIKDEVMRLKEQRYTQAMLKPEDVFQRYLDIAFSDITNFLEFGREEVAVMGPFGPIQVKVEGSKKKVPLMKEVNVVKFKESSIVDGMLVREIKQGKDGASIKLHDSMKALEWLTDHMNMANERQKLELAKLRHEVDQITGGNTDNSAIDEFLTAVNPTQEDIAAMFEDENEVMEDAEEIKEE